MLRLSNFTALSTLIFCLGACGDDAGTSRIRFDGGGQDGANQDGASQDGASQDGAADAPRVRDADLPTECTPAAERACYSGPPITREVGECKDGLRTCAGTPPLFGDCVGETVPDLEDGNGCDELDNDCDGVTDEGLGAACCETIRIAGANRWESTTAISRQFFASGAQSAVLFAIQAGDYPNPDGIVGGVLAANLGGPALGTYHANDQTTLHPAAKTELARLGVSTVYLIGGTAAIAPGVETELTNEGYSVTRFAGANRADTAALVAAEMGAPAQTAFVVNQGVGSAPLVDAAAVAGVAGRLGYPVLFVTTDTLPSETSAAINSLNISKTYVVGGTAAVSNVVSAMLPNPTRLSGADRYSTSVAVANQALNFQLPVDSVMLVSGTKPLDAMGAAAAGNVVLLVNPMAPLPTSVASWLAANGPTTGYIVGGTSVLDASVQSAYCPAAFP